jgi:hypothetical protein
MTLDDEDKAFIRLTIREALAGLQEPAGDDLSFDDFAKRQRERFRQRKKERKPHENQ